MVRDSLLFHSHGSLLALDHEAEAPSPILSFRLFGYFDCRVPEDADVSINAG